MWISTIYYTGIIDNQGGVTQINEQIGINRRLWGNYWNKRTVGINGQLIDIYRVTTLLNEQ